MADGTNPLRSDCVDCGATLTEVELTYYEYRCERCERAWCDAMEQDRLAARATEERK